MIIYLIPTAPTESFVVFFFFCVLNNCFLSSLQINNFIIPLPSGFMLLPLPLEDWVVTLFKIYFYLLAFTVSVWSKCFMVFFFFSLGHYYFYLLWTFFGSVSQLAPDESGQNIMCAMRCKYSRHAMSHGKKEQDETFQIFQKQEKQIYFWVINILPADHIVYRIPNLWFLKIHLLFCILDFFVYGDCITEIKYVHDMSLQFITILLRHWQQSVQPGLVYAVFAFCFFTECLVYTPRGTRPTPRCLEQAYSKQSLKIQAPIHFESATVNRETPTHNQPMV